MIFWIKELCREVIGAWPWYRLLFLIFNLRMRIVQVNRHYLLRYRRPERTSDLTSNTFGQLEAKHRIISSRSWLKRSVLQLLCIVSSFNARLENIYTSRYISSRFLGIICTDSRVSLFEVYIYSYWFHKVQRIVLIEWQSKASLRIELRSFRILLN